MSENDNKNENAKENDQNDQNDKSKKKTEDYKACEINYAKRFLYDLKVY